MCRLINTVYVKVRLGWRQNRLSNFAIGTDTHVVRNSRGSIKLETNIKRLLAISSLLIPLVARADGAIFAIGYAERDTIKGAEIELGYRKTFSSVGFNVIPLSGIWYSDPESRYREETFSNGHSACRDTSNGQFADSEMCSDKFSYAFRSEEHTSELQSH